VIPRGTALGVYRVEQHVGEGGAASVYKVRHDRLGSLHALKVLHIGGGRQRDRLLAEGQAQAALSHPNLVSVTDVVESDGRVALVMEFVEGVTLDVELHGRRLSAEEAELIFRGIVSGVAYAHAAGLVHRDLKPSNVLLRRIGDQIIPKVADFGLAKALEGRHSHTRTGTYMGTPPYSAPEQIRDAKGVDQRADVWALGCILYELLTGVRAYPQPTVVDVYQAISDGTRPAVLEQDPTAPPHLAAIAESCLERDPEARLPDARAIMVQLGMTPPPDAVRSPTVELSATPTPGSETFQLDDAQEAPRATQVPDDSRAARSVFSFPAAPAPSAPERSHTTDERHPARSRWPLAILLLALPPLSLGAWWLYTPSSPPPAQQGAEAPQAVPATPQPVATAEPSTEPSASEGPPSTEAAAATPTAEELPPAAGDPGLATATNEVESDVSSAPQAPSAVPSRPMGSFAGPEDGTPVWLTANGATSNPGPITPGDYEIYARFPEVGDVHAGRVHISTDEHVTLHCNAQMMQCGKEGP